MRKEESVSGNIESSFLNGLSSHHPAETNFSANKTYLLEAPRTAVFGASFASDSCSISLCAWAPFMRATRATKKATEHRCNTMVRLFCCCCCVCNSLLAYYWTVLRYGYRMIGSRSTSDGAVSMAIAIGMDELDLLRTRIAPGSCSNIWLGASNPGCSKK